MREMEALRRKYMFTFYPPGRSRSGLIKSTMNPYIHGLHPYQAAIKLQLTYIYSHGVEDDAQYFFEIWT